MFLSAELNTKLKLFTSQRSTKIIYLAEASAQYQLPLKHDLSLQTKLEEALNLAMEFHNSLQDFINWLTQAEQTLTAASRPSLILDTVLFQIDEHKVCKETDV